MKTISEYLEKPLAVVQPSIWKKSFELKYEDEQLCSISFPKTFRSKLVVEMFSGKWEIYQPGFWSSLIMIKEAGKDLPFAQYKRSGFKPYGILELPKGNRLKIAFKIFRLGWEIQTLSGVVLVSFRETYSVKHRVKVFIKKRNELLDKYPWIIVLAWYLAYKRRRSAAAH